MLSFLVPSSALVVGSAPEEHDSKGDETRDTALFASLLFVALTLSQVGGDEMRGALSRVGRPNGPHPHTCLDSLPPFLTILRQRAALCDGRIVAGSFGWCLGAGSRRVAGPGVALEVCQADESRPIEALESLSSSPIICRSLWLTRPVAGSVRLSTRDAVPWTAHLPTLSLRSLHRRTASIRSKAHTCRDSSALGSAILLPPSCLGIRPP